MKVFELYFCWTLKRPFKIIYDGTDKTITTDSTKCSAIDQRDIFKRLKGTSTKVVSALNGIKCLQ